MQGHSDDWIENRIMRTLGNRGLPDDKMVVGRESFDLVPGEMRVVAAREAVGRPVVGFVGGDQVWTLLGTDAVHSQYRDRPVHVRLDDIRQIILVGATLIPKKACEYVEVIDQQGARHMIWGPPGEGCLAICGVLQTMLRLQKKQKGHQGRDDFGA